MKNPKELILVMFVGVVLFTVIARHFVNLIFGAFT